MNAETIELVLAHVKASLAGWSLRRRMKTKHVVQKIKLEKCKIGGKRPRSCGNAYVYRVIESIVSKLSLLDGLPHDEDE